MTGRKVQGLLVILGAVLIGVAGGVLVERARDDSPVGSPLAGRPRPPRDGFGRGDRGRFPSAFENLQLTQDQRDRIDSIFRSWQPRTDAVMDEFLPRIRALRDSVRRAVDSVLTPAQLEQLQETMRRSGRESPRGHRDSGGPSGPPPDR